jgi:hypothetical protein
VKHINRQVRVNLSLVVAGVAGAVLTWCLLINFYSPGNASSSGLASGASGDTEVEALRFLQQELERTRQEGIDKDLIIERLVSDVPSNLA